MGRSGRFHQFRFPYIGAEVLSAIKPSGNESASRRVATVRVRFEAARELG
jgi:hypothetical protein